MLGTMNKGTKMLLNMALWSIMSSTLFSILQKHWCETKYMQVAPLAFRRILINCKAESETAHAIIGSLFKVIWGHIFNLILKLSIYAIKKSSQYN